MDLQRFEQMDGIMLMSIINTKLRDEFSSLEELAKFYDINLESLVAKLATVGYDYHREINQFR